MSLFFKENTLAEVIYLLNIFNKIRFFLGNSNNADRNDVNEQNTHRNIPFDRIGKGENCQRSEKERYEVGFS